MQTRKALAAFDGIDGEQPLGQDFVQSPVGQRYHRMALEAQQRIEDQKRQRIEGNISAPHLSVARKMVAEHLSETLAQNDTPIIETFHALQRVKANLDQRHHDAGLRRLTHQLKLAWERKPTGMLTIGDLERMRRHYREQYPHSAAADVIGQDLPKHGFSGGDMEMLTRAADQIQTQEDFDHFVTASGLDGDGIGVVRARELLMELVNRKLAGEPSQYSLMAQGEESMEMEAVSPPGWEEGVEELKKQKEVENPWALAWWMKEKGYDEPGTSKD